MAQRAQFPALLKARTSEILKQWVSEQENMLRNKMKASELADQCREFLNLVTTATQEGDLQGDGAAWDAVRNFLANLSRHRSQHGFSPSDTAVFVMSLKRPLFDLIRQDFSREPQQMADEIWASTMLLDKLALYTAESYQKSREELILRQQEEMLELSTPVVKLWDGVLALPLIGTLDSGRTQIVMESLLQKIVESNSETAIIDITGVPTVDTLVAQHLIKTVTAARLMGAECIISGIRPQIAATIVHLGVDLGGIATKSTLADAFGLALSRMGKGVGRVVGSNSNTSATSPKV